MTKTIKQLSVTVNKTMFELKRTFTFEAGHTLTHHDGKCRHPHGHSYILTVHIIAEELIQTGPKTNMVMDFSDISRITKQMLDEHLDHKWLNETLNSDSPTVEFIAKWIFDYLEPRLPQLSAVSLHETANSQVTYRRSPF